jgi:hypothetical protein
MLIASPGLTETAAAVRHPSNLPDNAFSYLPDNLDMHSDKNVTLFCLINSTYSVTAWLDCCEDHRGNLAASCYPCVVPDKYFEESR